MSNPKKKNRFSYLCFRIILAIVTFVYPKTAVEGAENLPDEPCIVVGNHAKMNGPIVGEVYFPGKRAIWCAGQMMHLKDVPSYAFTDFWGDKPKYIRWFFRLLSYVIAPFSVCLFNNAHTIPVYHDTRILTTFRRTFEALNEGKRIIIFPECAEKNNNIVNVFQDKFVDVAKMYYKKSGVKLRFVPMYVAPKLKKVCIGEPTVYNPDAPIADERRRICGYLSEEITAIATSLPPHTVVPYNNIPGKFYPRSIPEEEAK